MEGVNWGPRVSDFTSVTRKLVAVFAADVEGYSRLMGTDEVGTLKGLTERRAILDKLIDVPLAFLLFKVLSHEARRYRQTSPDLPPPSRLRAGMATPIPATRRRRRSGSSSRTNGIGSPAPICHAMSRWGGPTSHKVCIATC